MKCLLEAFPFVDLTKQTCFVQCIHFCRSVTPQTWEDFSRYNKDRADTEMRASQRLREAIHSTVAQTDNDLEAQRQATEFALRKRIHEMERAKDEDEWQKQNVRYFFMWDGLNLILKSTKNMVCLYVRYTKYFKKV